MPDRTLKRVYRKGRLSAEAAVRDRELRRKIEEEFPPLEAGPVSPVLSDPLREAIALSRKSVRWLAKKARVSEVVLRQFLDRERDLRLATAERLADCLGLKLVAS